MMSKKFFLYLIAVVALLLASACGPTAPVPTGGAAETDMEEAASEEAPAMGRGAGGTLTILYWQAASIGNPYLSGGTKDIDAAAIVLEPLANYDENGALVPTLATEIPSIENGGIAEDLISVTWNLKEGVLWSDGTPFTAEDAVFTYLYCSTPETGCGSATNYQDIESVEAIDDLTLKITFTGPKPYPFDPFVSAIAPILQKAQFENCVGEAAQQCSEENLSPIGTGPYKYVDFKVNDVVVYEINENFRVEDQPYFSEVIFKGGGDAASAARAVLETGEADYAWNLQVEPQILTSMEAAGLGTVVAAFATNVERLMVNRTNPDPNLGDQRSEWTADDPNPHPFLSDIAVRQALSMAIDRSVIAEQLYGAAGRPTCNVLPAPSQYASPNNDSCLVQDIDGANVLLDEAGWLPGDDGIRAKDGVRLSILYQTSTNSVRQKTQALIKQWWSEIGVKTELKNIDAAVFFGGDPNSPDTYGKFYTDIEMYTNGSSGLDPQIYMSSWQTHEIARAENNWLGNNVPRWYNEEYDALFDELTKTPVGPDREALVIAMNDLLVQDYALIPLVHRGSVSAYSNSLQGIRMNAWDSEMWNIEEWRR